MRRKHGHKAAFLAAKRDTVAPEFTHRSASLGAKLAGVKLFTFPTGETRGIPSAPTPRDYERAFDRFPSAQAALVTSPDYFGRTADVRGIKDVLRAARQAADCRRGARRGGISLLSPEYLYPLSDVPSIRKHRITML